MISFVRSKNKYSLKIGSKIVSSAKYYIYGLEDNISDFDWINITDVETDPRYRRKGYATALLTKMLSELEIRYPECGQYLFVKRDNIPAIRMYLQLGFQDLLSKKSDSGVWYILMIRGNADKNQLLKFDYNLS